MKNIALFVLITFIITFTFKIQAIDQIIEDNNIPDIVALVNDRPITKYAFIERKELVMVLNNIDINNPEVEKRLNENILNMLIEEELLNQQNSKTGNQVSEEEIDNSMMALEQQNNMPRGGLKEYLEDRGIDIVSFRQKIKADLIKYSIINSLASSVSITSEELNTAVDNALEIKNNTRNIPKVKIVAWQFSAKQDDEYTNAQMEILRRHLMNITKKNDKACPAILENFYEKFAVGTRINQELTEFSKETQSIILDTKVGKPGTIYREDNKYKLIFLCKKEIQAPEEYLKQIRLFLSNEKTSKQAAKLFKDLKARAYIKIFL